MCEHEGREFLQDTFAHRLSWLFFLQLISLDVHDNKLSGPLPDSWEAWGVSSPVRCQNVIHDILLND